MAASETLPFQAETRQLLDLVIHSLSSRKELFPRVLLSNASDAIDKLKLEALAHPALLDADPLIEIELVPDSRARALTASDRGIGMTRDQLVAMIGTIAKSGTRELVEQLKRSAPDESAARLIGQFGVGFYSAFMVVSRVEIVTCRAGTATATRWESSGDGTYTVGEASRFRRGTDIILHLKPVDAGDGLADYASAQVLTGLVKKHSDLVAHPIKLKEVSEAGYTEFDHHLSHDWQDPLDRLSLKAEGRLEINEAHPLVLKRRALHAASAVSLAATLTSFMTRALLVPILVAVCFGAALISGQGAGRETRPAFDGIWNSATVTPLERPLQLKDKAFFTPDEAAEWERQFAIRNEDPPPGAPRTGTGTYPTFYREFGTRTVKTLRTSIVTEPADGRIPPLTPAATEFRRRRLERMTVAENPEDLGLQDQCLTFLTAGPPLLPYSYNSNYQIVVTADAALIHAEMIHDTRIIHLDGRRHVSPRVRPWMGDSVGHWEGTTLVVDTTNFKAGSGFYGDAGGNFGWDENLHMIERFRLLDADTLLYQFDIDNPTAYTRPWKGELTMTRSSEQMYEFACHEANYSLENMMRGYRAAERKAGGPPRR